MKEDKNPCENGKMIFTCRNSTVSSDSLPETDHFSDQTYSLVKIFLQSKVMWKTWAGREGEGPQSPLHLSIRLGRLTLGVESLDHYMYTPSTSKLSAIFETLYSLKAK